MKHNKGMTLIEVLIASIILFIAVSAISFVMRSSLLHEKRLMNNVERGLLAEYIRDEVSYQYQYQNVSAGTYDIKNSTYTWVLSVLNSQPAIRFISSESENTTTTTDDNIVLYEVTVTKDDKKILSFKDVYWKQ
ncbi:type II secretion system protein [Pseudoalteromonas sp. SWXJZ94C]|uniref:PulJ/GspJ family protein n=1 Tax=unclassified Pseudoalteromonas TaxID=194690 RepID=UPI00140AC1BD|nr:MULTISPECIES: type II secretion system protein [unclassified Pseudoalteromonas]MBH0057969.1 type II secretion system protein [Pseudoalteromonas sp. SWXJZ94C]